MKEGVFVTHLISIAIVYIFWMAIDCLQPFNLHLKQSVAYLFYLLIVAIFIQVFKFYRSVIYKKVSRMVDDFCVSFMISLFTQVL